MYLVDLKGTSYKNVRRETSRFRQALAVMGAGLAVIAPALVEEPVQEIVKQVIQHQIQQISGLEILGLSSISEHLAEYAAEDAPDENVASAEGESYEYADQDEEYAEDEEYFEDEDEPAPARSGRRG